MISSSVRARLGVGAIATMVAAGLSVPSASLSTAHAQDRPGGGYIRAGLRGIDKLVSESTAIAHAEVERLRIALRAPCLDPDTKAGLIAGANAVIGQILELNNKSNTLLAGYSRARTADETIFGQQAGWIKDKIAEVNNKPECGAAAALGLWLSAGPTFVTSTTQFTSPTDAYKTRSNAGGVTIMGGIGDTGNASLMQSYVRGSGTFYENWYPVPRFSPDILYGRAEAAAAAAASGSFDQTFNSFPAGNFSGSVNSGSLYQGIVDIGANILQAPGFRAGPFVGYQMFSESIGGASNLSPNVSTTLINTRWQALRVGFGAEKVIFDGKAILSVNIAALPVVNLQSGAFEADGSGVSGGINLSIPLAAPYQVNIFARDTYMTVSGNTPSARPTPLDVKNNVFLFGVSLGSSIVY